MLKNIEKNIYNLYYKRDIEVFEMPMFKLYQTPGHYFSKTRLKREMKIILSEEQENNPHGFSQGKNGYYPIWDINKLKKERTGV